MATTVALHDFSKIEVAARPIPLCSQVKKLKKSVAQILYSSSASRENLEAPVMTTTDMDMTEKPTRIGGEDGGAVDAYL
jgi:hypothetical protein